MVNFLQGIQQLCRQFFSRNLMSHRLGNGAGNFFQFLRPLIGCLSHIHAKANNHVLKTAVRGNGHLAENAADLLAAHDQIISPFDLGTQPGRLLNTVAEDKTSKTVDRDYAIITLFLNCGMRLSELVGINLADISSDMSSLRVVGKGAKERMIYLNGACRDSLASYLAVRAAMPGIVDKNALFLSGRGQRISVKTVQWMVKKYLKLAGFENKRLSVHKLRHTAATLMYRTGKVDVRVLKDILGHEQLNTTQIYTHVSDDAMKAAIDANPISGTRK